MKNKEETQVRKVLKKLGFKLNKQQDERAEGVDIIAMKNGQVLLIEVKKARLHHRAWQVDAVSKKQQKLCNTIAIVTPKAMLIEPMSQHLKLCTKNGMRYVTESVDLFCTLVGVGNKGRDSGQE
jgi:Holliday junction resolvase-like predicted endonuclease